VEGVLSVNDLEKLTTATKMLAEVATAKDAWELARTAEAARQYALLRNLGAESINFATAIKAKAMVLLADLVDEGQKAGTITAAGRPKKSSEEEEKAPQSLVELGIGNNANQAAKAVFEARRLRDSLGGQDIDSLVKEANSRGEDLGVRGLRRMAADLRVPEPVREPVQLPVGRYQTICLDPPWDMRRLTLDKFPDQGHALDYPTLPSFCREGKCLREDCKSVQCVVGRVLDKSADDNCHLYCWTTQRFLPDALALVKSWNFHYQCCLYWLKKGSQGGDIGMTPFSWKFNVEPIIFAHRGNLKLNRMGMTLSFEGLAQGHSVKPQEFYDRVMEASPEPRLELFARKPREHFTVWGNESNGREVLS
jgi:N6-adenosine-specific RNA methylase IME4